MYSILHLIFDGNSYLFIACWFLEQAREIKLREINKEYKVSVF